MDSEHKTRGERTADCDPPVDSYPADLGLRQCTEATADLSARSLLQKLLVSLTGGVGISSSALGDITVEQCGWDVTVTFGTVNGGAQHTSPPSRCNKCDTASVPNVSLVDVTV